MAHPRSRLNHLKNRITCRFLSAFCILLSAFCILLSVFCILLSVFLHLTFCFSADFILLSCCLHAACNSERSGYCGENANRNLNHHFPSILLHRLLLFRDLRCRRHHLHCRYCRRWYPGHRWFRYRQLPAFHCLQFR